MKYGWLCILLAMALFANPNGVRAESEPPVTILPAASLNEPPLFQSPGLKVLPTEPIARAYSRAYPSTGLSIDTLDREAVRVFFNGLYSQSDNIAINWTGAQSSCNAGATDPLFHNAVALRINWFRAMSGVPANVKLSGEYSQQAQQAALVISANNALSHTPPSTWSCWNTTAYEAAGKSNLVLGGFGPSAVNAYIYDSGASNVAVGHRRWVLYPQTQNMGTGDVAPEGGDGASAKGANALWVFDNHQSDSRPAVRDDFVAWPPKGYVPYQAVAGRWSFSHSNADFSAATVSVIKNGLGVPISIEALQNGIGENSIVWLLQGTNGSTLWSKPTQDDTYQIIVDNVKIDGVTRSYSYSVTVIDPAKPASGTPQTTVLTPESASLNSPFTASVLPMPNATSYQVSMYRLASFPQTIASSDVLNPWTFVTGPKGAYNPVEPNSFHLYPSDFYTQVLSLNRDLYIGQSASLSFSSWFTYATSGQVAHVQISLDDGLSWQDIYTEQGGSSTVRARKSIDLSSYAGRFASIRFAFSTDWSIGGYTDPTTGWYFNSISLTNVNEMLDEQIVSITKPNTEASLRVGHEGMYAVAARSEYQGVYFTEWGPTRAISVSAASSNTPQSGWWWNANEGGRGYFIEVKNGRHFTASYLYDNSGNPLWYVTGPSNVSGSSLPGTLGAYSGGQSLTGAYKLPAGPNSAGNVSFSFSDSTHGTITWPGGMVPITRYEIAGGSLSLPSPSFKPETGWWWNAGEGGRGFSIEVQGDNLFIGGFMYDASGNPVWYVSAGKMTTPSLYRGNWIQYQNGQPMGGAFKMATVKNPNIGEVAIGFSSTTAATLYLPDGTTRQLTRYAF